jgi:hypothetical protein
MPENPLQIIAIVLHRKADPALLQPLDANANYVLLCKDLSG